MSTLTVASLCSGYDGLGMGLTLAGWPIRTIWHAENDPDASRVLAHHQPDVPNLGDITAIDWSRLEKPDIVTAGFPCQDISSAGKRAGIEGSRSGVWANVADAVRVLRPRLVLLENVAALLGRGMGRVLGDLAEIGYDADWACVRASDAGAPHRRDRVFITAYPADAAGVGFGDLWSQGRGRVAAALVAGGAGGGLSLLPTPRTTDTNGAGVHGEGGVDLRTAVTLLPTPNASDSQGGPRVLPERRTAGGVDFGPRLRDVAPTLLPTPTAVHWARNATAERSDPKPDTNTDGWTLSDVAFADRWGEYAAAIARWEEALATPAPAPTEVGPNGNARLAPRFVEWMQGLEAGHVTAVPGLSRSAQLRILGNGVVPQQCAAAVALMCDRYVEQPAS